MSRSLTLRLNFLLSDETKSKDEIKTSLEHAFPLRVMCDEETVLLPVSGVTEQLHLSLDGNEYAIFADHWHEHLEEYEDLLKFIGQLLSGNAEIVVKYRGDTAANRIVLKDGVKAYNKTKNIVSPFWRKMTIWRVSYKADNGVQLIADKFGSG